MLTAVAMVTPTAAHAQTLPTSEDCRDCHLGLSDERLSAPAVSYEGDVHAAAGFGCLACHGSGGSDRLDPAAGFLSAPRRRDVPVMCGRCHSDAAFMRQFDPGLRVDQVAEYWTSVHGQRLRELDDPGVATCVDCHPAHDIRPPDDPTSNVYAANIVATCGRCHADRDRVHGRLLLEEGDLSAPVCNDCHGNHGAAPPGLASVRNVCGQCHSVMADYFDQSAHGEVFNENDLPGCATCHDHHAIAPVSVETLHERSQDVCATCHAAPDTLGLAFDRMAAVIDTLEAAREASIAVLEEAENVGMEVSQAFFDLEEVSTAQTRARSAIHTFHVEPVRREVEAGLAVAERAEERGLEALAEHDYRRIGLGLSSAVILLLIIGLLMKIRQLEGEERA
jgi:predicted CXXCH cytochrome family protein